LTRFAQVPFDEALEDATGGNAKVLTSSLSSSGKYAVVDQGQQFVSGYVNDANLLYRRNGEPIILFGDHTKIIKYIDFDFVLGADGVKALKSRPGFHPRYLLHYLHCIPLPNNLGYSRHFKYLKAVTVPKPPLDEQERIAAVLDKADAIRKKRREALKLADDFLRSVFLNLFGDPVTNPKEWPTEQMGRVCSFYAGNSLPDGEPFIEQPGGVLHLKVGDMNLPGNEEIVLIAREWSEKAQGAIVAPAGAVLLPKRGGAIATNKKRILCRPCALDPNLMAVSPKAPLSIEYLYAWFGLFDLTTISSGSAVPQLNKGDLAPLRIQIPPETLLKKYSVVATKVKAMISTYREQLEDAEALFSALQQQAFA